MSALTMSPPITLQSGSPTYTRPRAPSGPRALPNHMRTHSDGPHVLSHPLHFAEHITSALARMPSTSSTISSIPTWGTRDSNASSGSGKGGGSGGSSGGDTIRPLHFPKKDAAAAPPSLTAPPALQPPVKSERPRSAAGAKKRISAQLAAAAEWAREVQTSSSSSAIPKGCRTPPAARPRPRCISETPLPQRARLIDQIEQPRRSSLAPFASRPGSAGDIYRVPPPPSSFLDLSNSVNSTSTSRSTKAFKGHSRSASQADLHPQIFRFSPDRPSFQAPAPRPRQQRWSSHSPKPKIAPALSEQSDSEQEEVLAPNFHALPDSGLADEFQQISDDSTRARKNEISRWSSTNSNASRSSDNRISSYFSAAASTSAPEPRIKLTPSLLGFGGPPVPPKMSRPSSSSGRRGSDTAGVGMGTPSHVADFNAAPRQISSGSMNAPAHAQIGKYSLGDCLGRGAFGSVFRGLNWITGETVAIKQIQLTNIPRSELGEIMSEIDLLKNLKHPNIVKYKGSEKTRDYLYIILEYCENGSLQHICKRFGKFPEGLVGVYISQVLAGLLYLHDQGVIHRDIKGANILTTKDGSVKLADFGVATRTGAMSDYAVVGSPYWMAPEVIDQSGACTASDIWSLGCVVIELLEGKPPYHDLDPMPALFRIVQDDCPPLPKSASPVVKDFLMLCFQKDANLRVSARKLLKHPWMANARKQLEAITSDGSMRGRTATIYDDAVKSVQQWNEALKEPARLPPLGRSVDSGTFKARAAHPPTYTHSPPSLSPAATQRTPTRRNTRSVSRPNGARELGVTPKAPPLPSNAAVKRTSSTSPAVPANDKGVGFARTAATPAIAPMATSLLESRREIAGAPIAQETADDNWDADFEEGIPTAKIAGFDKPMTSAPDADQTIPARGAKRNQAARDASSAQKNQKTPVVALQGAQNADLLDENFHTIRPRKDSRNSVEGRSVNQDARIGPPTPPKASAAGSPGPSTRYQRPPSLAPVVTLRNRDESVEDYSDLIAADDDSHLSERIRKLQAQNSVGPRLFHPNDLKSIATASKAVAGAGTGSSSKRNPSGQRQGPLSPLVSPTTSPTGSLARRNGIPRPSSPFTTRSPSQSRSNSVNVEKDAKWREMRRTLGKYSENGEEDYSDVFGEEKLSEKPVQAPSGSASGTLHLTDRLSTQTWSFEKELGEDDDPFAEIDGELIEDGDLEANLARDKQARNAAFVSSLVEALRADSAEDQLVDTCDQLEQLMLDEDTGAAMRRQMLLAHGALAIVQLLEITKSRLVLSRALGLLNVLIYDDTAAQETLCLIGAIPVVMGMTSKRFAHEIRLEAAHFIYSMCSASSLTLQFVLSCRGLKTLVDLIEDYSDQSQKELVWLGIGCINSVLELQASRNDFCRMLALEGLLEPLSAVLLLVIEDKEHEYAMTAQEQVLQTLLIFSSSDSWLKTKVATRGVLRRMLQACFLLDGKPLTLLMKSIKCLSMGGPSILDELQKADTIPTLVRVLGERAEGAHSSEIINQVLSATFSLCRLNKSRQEEAASAGVIPHLLQVVRSKSPLKQFALPILCDFAYAGKATRKAMNRDGGGVQFYLELLEDPYWQGQALEAIHIYLLEETAPVEDALLQSASIDRLVGVFTTATSGFENLLEPYLKILRLSPHGVTSAMAKSSAFIKRLIKRLDHSKAVVRLGLLRLTKLLCDSHPALIAQYKLLEVIEKLAQDDGAVLVRELAREVLEQLRSAGSTTVNDRGSIRRAVSDTHVGGVPVAVSSEKDSREKVASGTLAKGSIMTPSARQQAIPSPRRSPWNQGPGTGSTPNSTKGKTSPDRTLRRAGPSIKDGLDNPSLKRPIPTHSSRSHASSRSEMGKPSDPMAYRGSA